jgi:hypothetical protein
MSMEQWWNSDWKGKTEAFKEKSVSLTDYPSWIAVCLNQGLFYGKLKLICICYGMDIFCKYLRLYK